MSLTYQLADLAVSPTRHQGIVFSFTDGIMGTTKSWLNE